MGKPRLIYDGTCPVCTNYVRLIRKKVEADLIDFVSTTSMADEFQYVNSDNVVFQGNKAIDMFAKDFPSILDYVWMLPAQYKVSGLKAAYAVGSAIRKVVKKGCGCGKKKN